MPIYEYLCEECGKVTEVMQSFKDAPLDKCSACNGKLSKLISESSFVLKGTGWYKTDYASRPADPSKSKDSDKSTDSADSKNKPSDCSKCPAATSCS